MKLIVVTTWFKTFRSQEEIKKFEKQLQTIFENALGQAGLRPYKDYILMNSYAVGDYFKEMQVEVFDI